MSTVLMHGPAFKESGEIVERQVPETDVPAFTNAGYVKGPIPVSDEMTHEATHEVAEEAKPKKKK